jgi:hypothetical protein
MRSHRSSSASTITTACVIAAIALAGIPMSADLAGAQDRYAVEVVPQLGLYSAPTSVIDQDFGIDGSITAAHQSSFAVGGRVTYWIRSGLGIEGSLLYAPTSLDGQAFGIEGSTGANLFYGAGRVVLGFGQVDGVSRFHLSAGLAYAAPSYDQLDSEPFMAGVIGFGSRVPLGGSMALRFDLDDYISTQQWEYAGVSTDPRVQHDLVLSAGIAFLR